VIRQEFLAMVVASPLIALFGNHKQIKTMYSCQITDLDKAVKAINESVYFIDGYGRIWWGRYHYDETTVFSTVGCKSYDSTVW